MAKKLNIYSSLIISIVLTTTLTLILGEVFTHEFNILLDAPYYRKILFYVSKATHICIGNSYANHPILFYIF